MAHVNFTHICRSVTWRQKKSKEKPHEETKSQACSLDWKLPKVNFSMRGVREANGVSHGKFTAESREHVESSAKRMNVK